MITKKNIDKLLEMPDERLWAMLKLLLGGTGVDIGEKLNPKTMKKLRALLSEVTDDDIARALQLSEIYKRG